MKPRIVATRTRLRPAMTLKGSLPITSISYFPDGKQMISGSSDENVQKWDLQEGKEIKEARIVCEEDVNAVAVSQDGRWVITGGGESGRVELKACKVETGITTTFEGHSGPITCVDIALDSTLLVSGSWDVTARIWSLKTGKLVAGPFRSVDWVGAVRLSTDSKKLAVKSWTGRWLEIWDIKTETLTARIGEYGGPTSTSAPVFWTNKNKNVLTTLINSDITSMSEFDASTLKTVGAPFAGHTEAVTGLALSVDGALLASASSYDNTIKLWAFESRQLLASFDVQKPTCISLSPNSRQLAYTTSSKGDYKIYICNTTPDILARLRPMSHTQHGSSKVRVHRHPHIFWALMFSRRLIEPLSICLKYVLYSLYCSNSHKLLQSDATHRRRNPATSPAISFPPRLQQPLPATDSQQTFLHHLRRILRLSSPVNAAPREHHGQPRDPLDVCLFVLILP
jgi:WD40 repeat protein